MIEFDGYEIRHFQDDNYWIGYPTGEGMSISKEKLKALLDQLYEEEF